MQRIDRAPEEPPPAAGSTTPAANAPPRLVRFVEAEFPAEARAAGLAATVLLQLTVDTTGHVTEAEVLEGAGHGFDEAAAAAARQFEFTPAQQNGQPVAARLRYRYRFTQRTVEPAVPQGPAAVLRGAVRDAQNHPVAGATVTVTLPGVPDQQQVTDASGAFRFELRATGVATVSVSGTGYRDYRAAEQLYQRDDVQVVYRLAPAAPAVTAAAPPPGADPGEQEVTVRSHRPAREVTRTTLDRREIQRIPGTGGDPLRAIQNLPGVARPAFFSGALIVRGASPADTQVYVDGTVLPLLYHFGGLSSVIHSEMLDRIDFYPGNFSSRFGRAMAAIVDVGLRSPRRRGYRAVVNINSIDASLFAEGAITPNLTVAIAARRSYIDAILGAVLRATNSPIIAAPVYFDYQTVVEYRPNAANRFRLAILGDDDTLNLLFRRTEDVPPTLAGGITYSTRFHIAQLLWSHELGRGTRGQAMFSFGWTNVDVAAGELFRLRLNTFPINVRYELSHTLSRYTRLNVGFDVATGPVSVDFSAIQNSPNDEGSQAVASSINGSYFNAGTYLEAEITPFAGLRLVPGIRVDYYDMIRQTTVSPRANFRWELIPSLALKGGIGLYTQPPSFQQATSAPNTVFPGQTIGNPSLLPQRATHYAFGGEYSFTNLITLSVEGFYKSLEDLVVATPTAQLLQSPAPPPYNSGGIGRVYGMELLLRHKPSAHFFGWVAYTLIRSERRDEPAGQFRLFDQDQTHILTVLGSYRLPYGIEVGLRFRYVTGSPTTPVIGSFYNADSMDYTPINAPRNSARLRDFNQLDLRIDKGFRFRWGQLGIFLEILNVYNSANQEGVQFNYNYTMNQPVTGIPFYPNIGIRGEL